MNSWLDLGGPPLVPCAAWFLPAPRSASQHTRVAPAQIGTLHVVIKLSRTTMRDWTQKDHTLGLLQPGAHKKHTASHTCVQLLLCSSMSKWRSSNLCTYQPRLALTFFPRLLSDFLTHPRRSVDSTLAGSPPHYSNHGFYA